MPVSQHISISPFATVPLDGSHVEIEGRTFRVQKLQSASFHDYEREEAKKRGSSTTIAAHVKTLPPQVREAFRRGKKLSLMPLGAAERKVACELRKEMEAEFRTRTGIIYLNKHIRVKHKSELEPTSEQVAAELDRLITVFHAVTNSFEGD